MSLEHRIAQTWGAGSELVGGTVKIDGESEQNWSLAIPDGHTVQISWHFGKDNLLEFSIFSDQAVQVKLNSNVAPSDTIPIAANMLCQWYLAGGLPYPFSGEMTAGHDSVAVAFVQNNSGHTANFELRSLLA